MGIADKTYYLDADKNLTDDAEKAATVLINKGQEIPPEMADKYGIGKVAREAGTEEKSAVPSENKAKKPSENKGAK